MAGQVAFVNPRRTLSVSVTGSECELRCAHCGGHYLRHMVPIEDMLSRPPEGSHSYSSYLVSGGCSSHGMVPVLEHIDSVRTIGHASGKRVNMHVGLVSKEDDAKAIATVVDVVSFDLVGSESVIRRVYGVDYTVDEYARSFELLSRYCRVVPHICIGLDGGRPSGEVTALRLARELGAREVVLIIFIPTAGTPYADRRPPDIEHVREVVRDARSIFSDGAVKLGCMRPRGSYRSAVDTMCLDVGVDAIVLPHRDAVERAKEKGLELVWMEECCAL